MTQTEAIAQHLRTGHKLTPLQALKEFGCTRLAARIGELRADYGMDIRKKMVKTISGERFAEYYLQVFDKKGQGRLI